MTALARRDAIAARFARAVARYDDHADVQRHAASTLAARIAALPLPPRPRVLEIGCGTGLLTAALARHIAAADWTITDIAPEMVAATRLAADTGRIDLTGTAHYACLDGEHPDGSHLGQYDLVCSSLAVQWFNDLPAGLHRLAACLAPGGTLAISTLTADTFKEWRDAHRHFNLRAATPDYPDAGMLARALPGHAGSVTVDPQRVRFADGLGFVRSLKGIGATLPREGVRALHPSDFRRVLSRFTDDGATVTYEIAYGVWQRAADAS
jgi:malonyl-CoA O-methyltransferase